MKICPLPVRCIPDTGRSGCHSTRTNASAAISALRHARSMSRATARTASSQNAPCARTAPENGLITRVRQDLSYGSNLPTAIARNFCAKAQKMGYQKVYGQMDVAGLGVLFAFKDAPTLYGYEDNPQGAEMVVFWHKYLKPLSLDWHGRYCCCSTSSLCYSRAAQGVRRTTMNKTEMITMASTVRAHLNHWSLAISCILLTIAGFGFLLQA